MEAIFKALAEESRLRILSLLIEGEMCVCEIETGPGMTQSNVSRHLSALKNSGILDSSKKAQWAYYKISDQFKAENHSLWLYLQEKLIQMPCYGADQGKYRICRGDDLCQAAEL